MKTLITLYVDENVPEALQLVKVDLNLSSLGRALEWLLDFYKETTQTRGDTDGDDC